MTAEEDAKTNPRNFRFAKERRAAERKSVGAATAPAAPPSAEEASGLGKVILRNEFYRDGYRIALRVAVIQSVIILGLIGAMFFIIHVHQPENRYFATTEDGRLVPMVPLSQPNLSTPALMSWAAQAVTEVMTFGFNDYRRRLQESSRHFTRQGWESFKTALERSRIIETVEANSQVVSAAPRGAPILRREGVIQGRYQWTVEIPLALTYQSGSKTKTDSLIITLVIVRVSRLESPSGVGIAQWVGAAAAN